jgi:DNA-binding NtrC family response regulator
MEAVNQILLIDKNTETNNEAHNKIKSAKLTSNVKVALNGGHALLYLEQINERLSESNMVILLGMDLPIMNGYEFIHSFLSSKLLNRERVLLVVLKDNLTDEKIAALRAKGVTNFIEKNFEPQALEKIITSHFNSIKEKNNVNNMKLKSKSIENDHFHGKNAA